MTDLNNRDDDMLQAIGMGGHHETRSEFMHSELDAVEAAVELSELGQQNLAPEVSDSEKLEVLYQFALQGIELFEKIAPIIDAITPKQVEQIESAANNPFLKKLLGGMF